MGAPVVALGVARLDPGHVPTDHPSQLLLRFFDVLEPQLVLVAYLVVK